MLPEHVVNFSNIHRKYSFASQLVSDGKSRWIEYHLADWRSSRAATTQGPWILGLIESCFRYKFLGWPVQTCMRPSVVLKIEQWSVCDHEVRVPLHKVVLVSGSPIKYWHSMNNLSNDILIIDSIQSEAVESKRTDNNNNNIKMIRFVLESPGFVIREENREQLAILLSRWNFLV